MNRQGDSMAFRLQIDNEIYRLKAEQPKISYDQLANIINSQYGTNFTEDDMLAQWEAIDKPTKETTAAIFSEFHKLEIDFAGISQRTGISVARVRRQIARGLVNNIFKVCIIVRKRSISKLTKNFISLRNIKNLVVLILKPSNFRIVKEEYAILWNFISRNYEENSFRTVSDENYKLVYRELIILAETYKVNDILNNDSNEHGFERTILQQSNLQTDLFALLNNFRPKKQKQLTIDLVSDEEEESEEELPMAITTEEQPTVEKKREQVDEGSEEKQGGKGISLLDQLVVLYSQMSTLQRMQAEGFGDFKDEMARVAIKICALEQIAQHT